MSCPNCGHSLTNATYDNQLVLHCSTCGASFFEANGINRISVETAQQLVADKQEDIIVGQPKHCPKDGSQFVSISEDKIKPHDVTLLRCPTCQGVFVYPDDLLKFKLAQTAKIAFFKNWNKPLPALRTVLVFSFVALVSVSVITGLGTFTQSNVQPSQARDLIKQINITASPDKRYVFFYFSTAVPVSATLAVTDATDDTVQSRTISAELKTLHTVTLGDLNLNHDLWYQITCTDAQGNQVKSEKQRLILTPIR
ncbi:zf-TFIIB domain-containing protein [Patescibacteria group bacterium]|nr:zf-TFIIB domain-containing protein [Patescibacteria group bacterium]MCL5092005.1 zf-TFIIB domain-containing protein [Patescibacteria group bacterium]